MSSQKKLEKLDRLFIALFIAFIAPLLMAPDEDPCPTCRVVEAFYGALDAKDLDTAMAYIGEDAVLWRDNVAYRGKTEIREQLKREIMTYRYQVNDLVAGQEGVRYGWKLVSNGQVWTGTDSAIVDKGQILQSNVRLIP